MNSESSSDSVIVVGAGIIGIACAHYLSRAGMRVTVIDQGTVGGGCSQGNCGYICPSHVLPLTEPGAIRVAIQSLFRPNAPFRIRPRLSPALWHWLWQFAKRCTHRQMLMAAAPLKAILDSSLGEYRDLIVSQSLDCQWKERGLLYVLQTDEGMRSFAETDRLLTEHFGVSARQIDGGDLPSFDSALKSGLAGAFHYPHDVSVRPDLLNSQWAQRLRDEGGTFIEHCPLLQVGKRAGRVTHLETSQGTLRAENIVFAMGAWSARWSAELQCSIPVQVGKGYSVTMPRPERCPEHPLLFPEHRVGVSPFDDGFRLGSMMEFSGYDTSIPPRRIECLRESAKPYLVSPGTTGDQQTWYGWRPMTWDSLPIIGVVPGLANAYLATGHNMLGLSLAPATGKLTAELMQGRPPHIDPLPFSPTRFASRR